MSSNYVIMPAKSMSVGEQRPVRPIIAITPIQPKADKTRTSNIQNRKRNAPLQSIAPRSKRANVQRTDLSMFDDLLKQKPEGPNGPRKRENLAHMSLEERQQRRMMMNRVAAQTARDRKKMRGEKLEHALRQLITETRYLRDKVTDLEQQLSEAKAVIAQKESQQSMSTMSSMESSVDTIGSAASIYGPPLWERDFREHSELAPGFAEPAQCAQYDVSCISNDKHSVFQELVEVAGDIDFDALCNDLLEDGFPDFQGFETETVAPTAMAVQDVSCATSSAELNYSSNDASPQYALSPNEFPEYCYATSADSNCSVVPEDPLLTDYQTTTGFDFNVTENLSEYFY